MKELHMTHPRTRSMTIDAHDENIPVIRLRFITRPNGMAYFLTKDVGEYLGLNAIETGDCLEVLEHWNVPYIEETVDDRGKVIGPVGLITEQDYRKLTAEAVKRRASA
jgi:hypothetical protein